MNVLDSHKIIGLDCDGTLIKDKYGAGQTIHSEELRQYVIDQHKRKTFYIVTFRNADWARQVPRELSRYGITPDMLRSIVNCPNELWLLHHQAESLPNPTEEMRQGFEAYRDWKGMKCRELGCTVLVDDKEAHVKPGCDKYGITYVDILNFSYTPGDGKMDPRKDMRSTMNTIESFLKNEAVTEAKTEPAKKSFLKESAILSEKKALPPGFQENIDKMKAKAGKKPEAKAEDEPKDEDDEGEKKDIDEDIGITDDDYENQRDTRKRMEKEKKEKSKKEKPKNVKEGKVPPQFQANIDKMKAKAKGKKEEPEDDDDEDKETVKEDAPEGWEGTVKSMKKHKEIDNPFALTNWMKNKGMHSHKTKSGRDKHESADFDAKRLKLAETIFDQAMAKITALLESRLDEKWGEENVVNPSEKGKYKGKDLEDLRKQKANLEKKKPADRPKGKIQELDFAIRGKKASGGKWKGVTAD